MMRMLGRACLFPVLAALGVAGCTTPATTEHFFALTPAASIRSSTVEARSVDARLPGIVITAVSIPELVDRPQIVTRDGTYRVVLSEQNQWAEPLKQGVARALAAQVRRAVDTGGIAARVGAYPQSTIDDPQIRVVVDVQRFDAVPGGEAVIDASWTIRRADGATRIGQIRATRPVHTTDYVDIVGAWNGALDDVGVAIGTAVVSLGITPAPPLR
jgi:uncharacterized lipoprotein YmbA